MEHLTIKIRKPTGKRNYIGLPVLLEIETEGW